jgi:hypothetical protein
MENNGKIETWLTEVWGEKNNYLIIFDGIILDIIIFYVANFAVVKPSQRNTAVIFFYLRKRKCTIVNYSENVI